MDSPGQAKPGYGREWTRRWSPGSRAFVPYCGSEWVRERESGLGLVVSLAAENLIFALTKR